MRSVLFARVTALFSFYSILLSEYPSFWLKRSGDVRRASRSSSSARSLRATKRPMLALTAAPWQHPV